VTFHILNLHSTVDRCANNFRRYVPCRSFHRDYESASHMRAVIP
jgi:hypothetical protein